MFSSTILKRGFRKIRVNGQKKDLKMRRENQLSKITTTSKIDYLQRQHLSVAQQPKMKESISDVYISSEGAVNREKPNQNDSNRAPDIEYKHLEQYLHTFIKDKRRIITDPGRLLAYGTDASLYRLIPKIVVDVVCGVG